MYDMFVFIVLVLRWWLGTSRSNLSLFLAVQSSVRIKLVTVSKSSRVGFGVGLSVRFIVSTVFSYLKGVFGCKVVYIIL